MRPGAETGRAHNVEEDRMFRIGSESRWLRLAVPFAVAAGLLSGWADGAWAQAREEGAGVPLWEVTDGVNTIHLLGSIHLLREDAYPLDPVIYEAFDAAETVVFEVPLSEMMEQAGTLMARGMFPDGMTLDDVLSADLLEELERRSGELPIPLDAMRGMKPWYAALVLGTVALQRAGFQASMGVDMHFYERAVEAGKRIAGLETVRDQIDALDGLSTDAQLAYLRSTLDGLDSYVEQVDRATALWRRGDAEGLAALNREMMRENAELVERLLDARNRRWVPQIESLLHTGSPTLVIVGVGHLVGEGSVLALLDERGLHVRRVEAAVATGG
jgi:uncharacterized protein YbaP (TraB family)